MNGLGLRRPQWDGVERLQCGTDAALATRNAWVVRAPVGPYAKVGSGHDWRAAARKLALRAAAGGAGSKGLPKLSIPGAKLGARQPTSARTQDRHWRTRSSELTAVAAARWTGSDARPRPLDQAVVAPNRTAAARARNVP